MYQKDGDIKEGMLKFSCCSNRHIQSSASYPKCFFPYRF